MTGRIPGFSYNPKKHVAQFSLYVPKTNGKVRRERTVHAESREEAIRLWQAFRDEFSGNPPELEPPAQPRVMTFGAFVMEYLEKICGRGNGRWSRSRRCVGVRWMSVVPAV